MAVITYPTLSATAPQSIRWGQRNNTFLHVSPHSKSAQTIEMPGAKWYLEGAYPILKEADRALWEAFMAAMRGQANRFRIHDFSRPVPRGTLRGTLTVSGAHAQGATSIVITGGSGQNGNTLLAGDKLSINGQLVISITPIATHTAGTLTFTCEPPLRNALVGGEPVVWDRATAQFMMMSADWDIEVEAPNIANVRFQAIEMF